MLEKFHMLNISYLALVFVSKSVLMSSVNHSVLMQSEPNYKVTEMISFCLEGNVDDLSTALTFVCNKNL